MKNVGNFHSAYDYMQLPEDQKELRMYDQSTEVLPDQSLSIREIIARSHSGIPIEGRSDFYYDEDEEPEPIGGFDLTDIDESNKIFNQLNNATKNQRTVTANAREEVQKVPGTEEPNAKSDA